MTQSFTAGSGDYGTYDFSANDSTGASDSLSGVVLDGEEPVLDSRSPTGYINDDSPTVSFDVSDSHSGINSSTYRLWVEDEDDNEIENQSATNYELDNLDDETYTAYYSVKDNVGNQLTGNWEFTVDNSYDVANPSLDWKAIENNEVVKMSDDVELVLGFDEDEEEPSAVTCYDGDADDSDNEVDEASDIDDSDNMYKFRCDFDEDDYDGGDEINLQLRVEDRAGNTKTYDEGDFTFDKEDPEVSDLSTPVGTVTGDFEVNFETDDDTGIEEIEYFFNDEDTDLGDGNQVDADENSFTADVEDLDEGQHTLYVRAMDPVETWSDLAELDFNYLPDASEKLAVSAPSSMEVTAGQTSELTITLNNTGRIIIGETNVSIEGLNSDTQTVTGLMPDESIDVTFDVSAGEEDIGRETITVRTSDPSSQNIVNVRVKANSQQQSQIQSTLSDYESRLSDLETKVTELQSKGISEGLSERLDSNYTDFKSKVDAARSQVQNGDYYRAQSTLDTIDSSYNSAQTSYQNVEQIRKNNQRNMMIMAGVGLLLLIGIGGSGVYVYSTDITPQEFEHRLGLDNLKEKLKSATESEPEAKEFEWDGFR